MVKIGDEGYLQPDCARIVEHAVVGENVCRAQTRDDHLQISSTHERIVYQQR